MTTAATPFADPLAIARELILRPGGLDDSRLDVALSQVMSSSIDAADLYFQLSREESWALEDGIVKEGSASIEQGVGVRALAGEKTGFAYSDEIVLPALEEASRAARAIARAGNDRACRRSLPASGHRCICPWTRSRASPPAKRWRWLERVDRETRKIDPRVMQVMASVVGRARSGAGGELRRPDWPPTCGRWCASTSSVIVEQNGRREQGYAGCAAGVSRCRSWSRTTSRCSWRARPCARRW